MLCALGGHATAQSQQQSANQTTAVQHRVVSLAPHLAEMVAAAGGTQQLVGVSRYSDFPAEVAQLPLVGDAFAFNYEVIVKLKPTLVLAWKGGTPERHIEKLKSLNIAVREVELTRMQHVPRELRALGALLGTSSVADSAAQQFEDQLQLLRAQQPKTAEAPAVFYQIWSRPLMTIGGQHVVSEAIELCGGRNVFADVTQLTATVSPESVVARKPSLIITAAPTSLRNTEQQRLRAQWQPLRSVPAVQKLQLHVLDADLLNRMGPRLQQGVAQLCKVIAAAHSQ
jgi:iron complex transport system substrate-binding protein